jgi:serine/threonine protein kinase
MRYLRRRQSHVPASLSILVCLCFFHSSFFPNRRNIPAKFLATDFTSHAKHTLLDDFRCPSPLCPENLVPSRSNDGLSIGDRYIFDRVLSSGHEGTHEIYFDNTTKKHVSIKSFYDRRDVFRNTLPPAARKVFGVQKWPTEIPAMLLFASPTHNQAMEIGNKDIVGFIDYFMLDDHGCKKWQLVTEFYHRGTLLNAGGRLACELGLSPDTTTAQLDHIFRKSFTELLKTLSGLHDAGFCHDDIKPANIFISNHDPLTWILGDLGQVREHNHTHHYSNKWRTQGQWKDCVLNDIRRTLKVYLSFLRSFHRDTSSFDSDLMQGREDWTRFYWNYFGDPSTASSEHLSEADNGFSRPSQSTESVPLGNMRLKRLIWRLVVDHELNCSFRSPLHLLLDKFVVGI